MMTDDEPELTPEAEEQPTSEITAAAAPDEIIDVPGELSGGREVSDALLDHAVTWLNQTYVRRGMETVQEIGRFVIDTFFAGHVDSFREHGRNHVSFRALAKREDLRVSYQWLWRAVSIVLQLEALPEAAATKLPYTHHTLLLPIKDEKKKAKLANKAMEKGLSKREFELAVRKVRDKERGGSRVGRRPLPRFIKTINKLEKLAVESDDLWGDIEEIGVLGGEEAQRLYSAVTGMKLRCERLQAELQPRVPGFQATE